MKVFALVVAFLPIFAFAGTDPRPGFFCQATGTGTWGLQEQEFYFQSHFIQANPLENEKITIELTVGTVPAATFELLKYTDEDLEVLSATQSWTGTSLANPDLRLELLLDETGQNALFTFNDWKNENLQVFGQCL